jgi:hypothetical protein
MRAESEALVCNPPGASDDANDVARPITITIPAGSSSPVFQLPYTECWYTVTSDVDCFLRGGGTSALGPAIVSDFPIWSKSYQQYWASTNTDGFIRVRGAGTGGTLYLYRSNR